MPAHDLVDQETGAYKVSPTLYRKILAVTDKYLGVLMNVVAMVHDDEKQVNAFRIQATISEKCPASESLVIKKLAQKADTWPGISAGRIELIVERLIMASQYETGVAI